MPILKNKKNNKYFIYIIFILVLSLLIIVTMSLGNKDKEASQSNEAGVNNVVDESELGEANIMPAEDYDNYNKEINNPNNSDDEDNQEEADNFRNDQEFLSLSFDRESYLNENISKLSKTNEVLGGSFFITSIDWIDEKTAVIEYEDGHIALVAEVEFKENSTEVSSFTELDSFEEEGDDGAAALSGEITDMTSEEW